MTQIAPNYDIKAINHHFLKAFDTLYYWSPGIMSSITEKHAQYTYIGPINIPIKLEVATKAVHLGSKLVNNCCG